MEELRGNITMSVGETGVRGGKKYMIHIDDYQLFFDGQKFQKWENRAQLYTRARGEKKLAQLLKHKNN